MGRKRGIWREENRRKERVDRNRGERQYREMG